MEHYFDKIRENGLKVTPLRKALIKLFIDQDSHMTPEDTWFKLKSKFKQCGLPSVYRNLENLADCGILARIQQFDNKKHYGLCTSGKNRHHHHIVCISCGKVDTISECAIPGKKRIKGFRIIDHYLQVNGICEDCSSMSKGLSSD